MDMNTKANIAAAAHGNSTLHRLLEGVFERLEAVENQKPGGGKNTSNVEPWATVGNTDTIPDNKIGHVIARDTEVEKEIAAAARRRKRPRKRPPSPRRRPSPRSKENGMKIRLEHATAAQLRQFVAERFHIEVHATATRANCIAKLDSLDPGHGDEIDIDEMPSEDETKDALDAANQGPQGEISAERWQQALVDAGMSEASAKAMVAGNAPTQSSSVSRDLPTGEDAEKLWCTIRLTEAEGAGGSEPVPVGVNGRVQLIPRGKDVEVRLPYVAVLKNAEKIVYDEHMEADGIRSRMVPRVVPVYPIAFVSEPYDKPRLAAQA